MMIFKVKISGKLSYWGKGSLAEENWEKLNCQYSLPELAL